MFRAVLFILAVLSLHSQVSAQAKPDDLAALKKSAEQFFAQSDTDKLKKTIDKILDVCNDQSVAVAKADPQRLAMLYFAADVDYRLGDRKRCLKTLDTIIAAAQPGTTVAVSALALRFKIRDESGDTEPAEALTLIEKTWSLADKVLAGQCQDLAIDSIVTRFSRKKLSVKEIKSACTTMTRDLVQQGVPIAIAKLPRFAEAENSKTHSDLESLAAVLADLELVIQDEGVTFYRRAQYFHFLASMHLDRRHYSDAFDACESFEANAKSAGRLDLIGIARDQSALALLRIGDYGAAKTLLETTRAVSTSKIDIRSERQRLIQLENEINWRINFAKASEGVNEITSARSQLQQSAEQLKSDRTQLPRSAANVDNNLALNFYLTGEIQTATKLFSKAKDVIDGLPGRTPDVGEALINAGWMAFAAGKLAEADAGFSKAAAYFQENFSRSHPRFAEALTYQARVKSEQQQIAEARQLIVQAEQLVYTRVCQDMRFSASQRDRIALVQEARVHPESIAWPGTIDTFLELAPKLGISDADQYAAVLRWKGLVERFSQFDQVLPKQEDELRQKIREAYFRKVSFLKRRALLEEIEGYETRLRRMEQTRHAARDIATNTPDATIADVSANLAKNDLLVDVFQVRNFRPPAPETLVGSGREYVGFLVNADQTVKRISFGDVSTLDAAIGRWGGLISDRQFEPIASHPAGDTSQLSAASKAVSKLIQRPIVEAKLSFDRLQIRADGAMHLVPWSALPGINGKRYWVENIQLQVANRPDQKRKPSVPSAESMLVIGGVDFGTLNKPLPGTKIEKDRIVRLFKNLFGEEHLVAFEGKDATEQNLLSRMPNERYIHLATHGFYHRRDESNVFGVVGASGLLRTGLMVAPANSTEGVVAQFDQYLTADEISKLDLSQTELVVLSACESGLGQPLAGQGVQGMLDAFHSAGAKNVVGTLWVVDDAATTAIIDRFYHHLWQNKLPPNEALRAAQLDMLQTPPNDPNYSLFTHPYAWAGFVCSSQ